MGPEREENTTNREEGAVLMDWAEDKIINLTAGQSNAKKGENDATRSMGVFGRRYPHTE